MVVCTDKKVPWNAVMRSSMIADSMYSDTIVGLSESIMRLCVCARVRALVHACVFVCASDCLIFIQTFSVFSNHRA